MPHVTPHDHIVHDITPHTCDGVHATAHCEPASCRDTHTEKEGGILGFEIVLHTTKLVILHALPHLTPSILTPYRPPTPPPPLDPMSYTSNSPPLVPSPSLLSQCPYL